MRRAGGALLFLCLLGLALDAATAEANHLKVRTPYAGEGRVGSGLLV